MNCASQHHTGRTCILMRWNGSKSNAYDPSVGNPVNYVGFYLQSKLESRAPNPEIGIDISSGGYKFLEFWVKGCLTDGVTFKVASDACGEDINAVKYSDCNLTNSWQLMKIEITTPEGADPSKKVVNMVLFVLEAMDESNGGEVYIDDIKYAK